MKCVNVYKYFNKGKENECIALENINIEFSDTGLVFIIGKSGSGKSTLLNIIGGLDNPSTGNVYDENLNLTKLNENEKNIYRRNNIGFIFQDYSLIYEMSAKENILLGLKKTEKQLKYFDEVLELLDIKKIIDKPVRELSGGEQQRVAIARALVKDSKIILGDEPTGSLDSANSEIIFKTLKEIAQNRLVIIVTHDYESAVKYGDRIITLSDGRVIDDTNKNQKESAVHIDLNSMPECRIKTSVALRLSLKLMGTKKTRMIVSSILTALSLCILGVFILFKQYNFKTVVTDILTNNHEEYITIGKGYTDKKSKKFVTMARVISEDDIEQLVTSNNIKEYDCTYKLLGMYLSTSPTGNRFIPQYVTKAIVSDEIGIEKYGLSFECGKYPTLANEVCITDYLAYCISILQPDLIANILGMDNLADISNDDLLLKGLKNMNKQKLQILFGENWSDKILKDSTLEKIRDNPGILLVNEDVDFLGNKYHISGILETNFEEKYKDLIYMTEVELNDDKRTDEFNFYVSAYYTSFFVNESFIDHIYQDKIIFTNSVFCKYSSFKELLNIKKELNYNDVIVSSNFFRETFKEEFNSNKIGSYKFPNIVSIPLGEGMDPEIIFQGEDLNVIGTTEIPADYNNTLYSSMAIVVSDQYFEDFAKAQSYCCYITFPVPKDYKLKLQLFEYMEDKELFLSSIYSYTLYEISNIMNLYMELFGIIIFVITSVAVLLLSGYFSSIITTQKREIGIMRAMGLTRRFILKIYMPSGVIMSAFILVVSSSGLLILQKIINNSLTENFLNYLDSVAINNFKILTLNYVPFAVIFTLSILISMISMIIPVNKISRSNPVDTIRR